MQSTNQPLTELFNTKLNGLFDLVKEKGFKPNAAKQSEVNTYIDSANSEFKDLVDKTFESVKTVEKQKTNKKDPNAPKRPCTSYIYFSNDVRKNLQEKNPELKPKQLAAKIGELWKGLTDVQKVPYENLYKDAKAKFDIAKANYVPAAGFEVEEKSSKKVKDPNAPKKPKNSFMFFCEENRDLVKEKNASFSPKEVTKKLAETWRDLSDDEKQKYKDKADQDKTKYDKAKENYVPNNQPLNDEKKPTREKSAYTNFSNELRPKIKASNPNAKFGELSKILSEKWATLSDAQKASYKTNKEDSVVTEQTTGKKEQVVAEPTVVGKKGKKGQEPNAHVETSAEPVSKKKKPAVAK